MKTIRLESTILKRSETYFINQTCFSHFTEIFNQILLNKFITNNITNLLQVRFFSTN
jgi:hypothetical protein